MTALPAPSPRLSPVVFGNALGVALIVIGGLVAAVTGPLQLERGSWLAAYLVLVGGVAQSLISRVLEPAAWAAGRGGWATIAAWNVGNLLVIVGALTRVPLIADLGGLMIVAPLVVALRTVFATPSAGSGRVARALMALPLFVVLIGVPVGLALTHLRAAG
ncbi:hypothetical protein [Agromyces laixinhei]|uniref:hypothetical protein n=1 Tax=Agromyces laixinhei TaxID=2585717 RepID=UPI0012EDE970|nr:hypothetical protein [Agromyces laixinhei]